MSTLCIIVYNCWNWEIKIFTSSAI